MRNYSSHMFYPATVSLPAELRTADFILTPLTPAHVELDYTAVTASREMLRQWSGSSWPSDDFSLDDNLQDLAGHDREHRERLAFTYTVLNPAQDACLGCVYIRPLSEILPAAPDYHAITRFWVSQSYREGSLERKLLEALCAWLHSDAWAFERILFHTRVSSQWQIHLFIVAGCQAVNTHYLPERGGYHTFFERLPEV